MAGGDRLISKREHGFTGERGALAPAGPGKTRITIRLDTKILDHFSDLMHARGGGHYQTLINDALREHLRDEGLEQVVRRVVREEVGAIKAALKRSA